MCCIFYFPPFFFFFFLCLCEVVCTVCAVHTISPCETHPFSSSLYHPPRTKLSSFPFPLLFTLLCFYPNGWHPTMIRSGGVCSITILFLFLFLFFVYFFEPNVKAKSISCGKCVDRVSEVLSGGSVTRSEKDTLVVSMWPNFYPRAKPSFVTF